MTFEDLQRVNKRLGTMDIKGKAYVLVNERVKAFRELYPEGSIQTQLVSDENGVCTIKASVMIGDLVLATGYAQEKESSTYINKTSYIENCETSAVGRALGFLGIGIDTSIASAEEVDTAIRNQGGLPANMQKTLAKVAEAHGYTETDICGHFGVKAYKDLSVPQFKKLMDSMGENG